MKIGPLEILVILFVTFSVALVFRLFRGDRPQPGHGDANQVQVSGTRGVASGTNQLKITGIALVVMGIIVLFLGMRLFELVMKVYVGALVLVLAGIAILYFSRNR